MRSPRPADPSLAGTTEGGPHSAPRVPAPPAHPASELPLPAPTGSPSDPHLRGRIFRVTVLLGVAGAALAAALVTTAAYWRRADHHLEISDRYEITTRVDSRAVRDLGVADIDGTDPLDVYTTNHSWREVFLLGEPNGSFRQVLPRHLGLAQTPTLSAAATASLPDRERPGLSLGMFRSSIVLRATVKDPEDQGRGEIRFSWPAAVSAFGGVSAEHEAIQKGTVTATRVSFRAESDGELWIEPRPAPSDGFPIEIDLLDGFRVDRVYVGSEGVNPPRFRFVLTPKDRHGLAWADLDGDGRTDLFVSRGGVRGRATEVGVDRDELFRGTAGGFTRRIEGSGLVKAGCPGRQASWIDIDGDNRLDLYVACGRATSPGDQAPNLLFRQLPDGTFMETADALGLAIPGDGRFAWLDADDDGDPDLLWADREQVALYRRRDDSYHREPISEASGPPAAWTVSDFDRDGDLDAHLVSRAGDLLLVQEGGRFRVRYPRELGLPDRSLTASWVDVDNDGLVDLVSLPGGIHRQSEDGRFEATGLLSVRPPRLARALTFILGPSVLRDARASWFDADRDGALDVVVGFEPCWPGSWCGREDGILRSTRHGWSRITDRPPAASLFRDGRWRIKVLRAKGTENHWLSIRVSGPPGNTDSIGAQLSVRTDGGVQLAQVGHLDGAHESQGNYRIHIGLGAARLVDALEVRWPDGSRATCEALEADQHLVIRHPSRQTPESPAGACSTEALGDLSPLDERGT